MKTLTTFHVPPHTYPLTQKRELVSTSSVLSGAEASPFLSQPLQSRRRRPCVVQLLHPSFTSSRTSNSFVTFAHFCF